MKTYVYDLIKTLPRVPGVYLFKNSKSNVVYVGKAKDLKNRVNSYFHGGYPKETKTYALVSQIKDIEYIEVSSELEALILEAELIKKYKPKYNIIYKDDKSYIYIVLRRDSILIDGVKKNIPTVITARKSDLRKGDKYFGPYPDGTTAKYIVRTVRKIFTFRDCTRSKFLKYNKINKPCLYGHINLCSAPCVYNSDINLKSYLKDINRIKEILSGNSNKVYLEIERKMKHFSKNEEYEKAAQLRDLHQKYLYITQKSRSPEDYLENPQLISDKVLDSLKILENSIPNLNTVPNRIECYDISNISGKEAVGSLVVATKGRLDKSQYRKFKIKYKSTPDDYLMIQEVLFRRFKRNKKSDADNTSNKAWKTPDLIVVDGGRGQVTSVLRSMHMNGVHYPVVGLEKKNETIVYFYKNRFQSINLSKDNPGLQLLILLRDEAHRFAQKYHHQLRLSKIISN